MSVPADRHVCVCTHKRAHYKGATFRRLQTVVTPAIALVLRSASGLQSAGAITGTSSLHKKNKKNNCTHGISGH